MFLAATFITRVELKQYNPLAQLNHLPTHTTAQSLRGLRSEPALEKTRTQSRSKLLVNCIKCAFVMKIPGA